MDEKQSNKTRLLYDDNQTLLKWMRLRRHSLRIYSRTGSDASLSLSRSPAIQRSPFSSFVIVPADAFTLLQGSLRFHDSPSDAVGKTHRGFCPDCGSPMAVKSDSVSHIIAIRTASLDHPSWFNLQMDVWTSDAHPWDQMIPTLPKFEKYPTQA
ncbi:MAG TPA: GFA family protein [Candidatus Udaeobacter sp.]|nr:GFA family protein [Candidatus Udaeobacter sp.]